MKRDGEQPKHCQRGVLTLLYKVEVIVVVVISWYMNEKKAWKQDKLKPIIFGHTMYNDKYACKTQYCSTFSIAQFLHADADFLRTYCVTFRVNGKLKGPRQYCHTLNSLEQITGAMMFTERGSGKAAS